MRKRITGLLLAAAMLLSSLSALTGCDNKGGDEWSITEEDFKNAVYLEMSLAKDDAGTVSLTAISDEDIFKSDLKDGYFYIVPITDTNKADSSEAEAAAETDSSKTLTGDVLSKKAVKNVTYNRADGKTLTFSFSDTSEDVLGYTAYIHKNAVTNGSYALALGVADTADENTAVASVSVDEKFSTATVNPTITVKLNNTDTAEGFNKDMITLDNAFANLTVTDVSGEGGTIVVSTSGNVIPESSLNGTVKLSDNATTYGEELCANVPIDFVTAYIDEATFKYSAEKLSFDLCLASDTFLTTDGITVDDMTVTVDSLSEDKTRATVSVAVSDADIDAAIDAVSDKNIIVDASAVAGGKEYAVPFSATKVGFGSFIDFIAKNDNSDSFAVEAYLFAKNGSFGTLSASDIALGGDFAAAADISAEKVSDTEYSLKFNFVPSAEVNEENFTFNGTVTLAAEKLNNSWNTARKEALTAAVSYSNESDRFGLMTAITAIKAAAGAIGTFVSDHESVVSAVKGVGSAVGPIKSALGFLGIIPTTDSMLKEIQSTLNEIQGTLSQMDKEISQIGDAVATVAVAVEELNYQQQKLAAQTRWNMFVDTMTNMNGYIASFKSEYYAQLRAIVSKKNTSITIYRNEDGVTLPLNMDSNSILGIDGKRIASTSEVSLPEGLPLAVDMIQNNGGNVSQCYDAFLESVKSEIANYLPEDATAEEFADELCLMASYRAMANIGGATKVVNSYIDLCANIAGTKAGKTKPLDDYFTMLANTYNFASETEAQRGAASLYLSDAVINGGFIAAMASTLLGDENVQNQVDAAYSAANSEIENNTGDPTSAQTGEQWCYLTGTWISGEVQNRYYTRPSGQYIDNVTICKVLIHRQQRLYAAGAIDSSSLAEYFKFLGLCDFSSGATRWVCGTGVTNRSPNYGGWSIPCTEVTCVDDYSGGGYAGLSVGTKWTPGVKIGDCPNVWEDIHEITNCDAFSGDFTAYRYATAYFVGEWGEYKATFCEDDGYPYWLYLICK